jgi:hypothetical protein
MNQSLNFNSPDGKESNLTVRCCTLPEGSFTFMKDLFDIVPIEIWKDIDGFDGVFKISSHGRCKSIDRLRFVDNGNIKGKFIRGVLTTKKYLAYHLQYKGIRYSFQSHRLVAEAFIPNPNNYPEVNHKDGNKLNNHVENLEWCTCKQNTRHAFDTGLRVAMRGERNGQNKFKKASIIELKAKRRAGASARLLAKEYRMEISTVYYIMNGKLWPDVP